MAGEVKVLGLEMEALVKKALFDSLTEDTKNQLIRESIEHLLKRDSKGYSGYSSPLDEAFRRALETCSREWVMEFVKNDPVIKEKFQKIVTDALEQCLTVQRDVLINEIVKAFINAFQVKS